MLIYKEPKNKMDDDLWQSGYEIMRTVQENAFIVTNGKHDLRLKRWYTKQDTIISQSGKMSWDSFPQI